MASTSAPDVTALLQAWGQGDRAALDALVPVVYDELRRQADRYMRRQPVGHTLGATAVVHEAYVRLVQRPGSAWRSREHFFSVASKVMRSVLVDHARARRAAKRGQGEVPLLLDEADAVGGAHQTQSAVDVLALDEALTRFAEFDPGKSRIVELRYFTGLTVEEIAEVLGVSPATVKREWTAARAWLKRELSAS